MLTRKSNPSDPNTKRYPYHIWSNDPALNHIIQNQIGPDEYPLDVQAAEVSRVFEPLSDEVFAYQEMNKTSGKVQNDKNIYNSVTTLKITRGQQFK